MKTILEYQCEICTTRYPSAEQALKCEADGRFDPKKFPVGLMYSLFHHGYVGIFAIYPGGATEYHRQGHVGQISWWACRAPGFPGDSLGDEHCGNGGLYRSSDKALKEFNAYHHMSKDKVGSPEFKRMVNWLNTQNIKPMYYNELGDLIIVKT